MAFLLFFEWALQYSLPMFILFSVNFNAELSRGKRPCCRWSVHYSSLLGTTNRKAPNARVLRVKFEVQKWVVG